MAGLLGSHRTQIKGTPKIVIQDKGRKLMVKENWMKEILSMCEY